MSTLHDTQPTTPIRTDEDTQPKRPKSKPDPTANHGPGCLAWGLLSVAALAFSLMLVVISGVSGYWSGQSAVIALAANTQEAFVQEQLTTWIPRDLESGNVALLGARIDGLASLTPPPAQLAQLVVTATQFAVDQQPTITNTPTITPTATPTPIPEATLTPTDTPPPTTDPSAAADPNAPLFDVNTLYLEAQTQMDNGEYDEATKTLDAIMAIDENFRPDEINDMMLNSLTQQAINLLRSGDPANLAAGIIKADEAAEYGEIGDIAYERYIAGLYLNALSRETTNPLGAIEGFSQVYAQAPNYLDVRQRLYRNRVTLGDTYLEAADYCGAAAQYQAALQIQTGIDVETKLQTAQTSCSSGQPPAEGQTPNAEGASVTATPSGPAPLGERSD